jgi:hypothetical protein
MTGWPEELLRRGIEELMTPDPGSNSDAHDGRRLIPHEQHGGKDWGWRAVNHGKYREKARKAMRQIEETASGRDAERKRHERMSGDVQSCPAMSGESGSVRLSDTDTDKEVEGRGLGRGIEKARKRAPRCPDGFDPDTGFASNEIPDLDVAVEVAKFRDWEFKTPRSDWAATWRNWIRRCKQTGDYAKKSGGVKWR